VPLPALLVLAALLAFVVFSIAWHWVSHVHYRNLVANLPRHGGLKDYLSILVMPAIFTFIRLLEKVGPGLPKRPSEIVFVIGIPRSGTTSIHRSMVHASKASCVTPLDLMLPPAPGVLQLIQGILKPIAKQFVRLGQGSRHVVDIDLPEEEDQGLLHEWRNVASTLLFTGSLNSACGLNKSWSAMRNDRELSSFQHIDRLVRYKCHQEGSDIFVGKPLTCTHYYAMLMEYFPEAKYVVTWREPVSIIGSALSLGHMQLQHCLPIDKADKDIGGFFAQLYRAVIELRAKFEDDPRFAFVPFTEWIKNPHEQAASISKKLSMTIKDSTPPPPKTEDKLDPSITAKYTAIAEGIVRDDWKEVWKEIYAKLDFPTPAFML